MITVHVTISGRVQGVGYRAWAMEIAQEIRLRGWIRNRSSGAVEAVFQGEADHVYKMIKDCSAGPSMAIVGGVVKSEPLADQPIYSSFVSKPTL